MKAASLFSGIGGFELGLQRAGIETVLQVESNGECVKVLEKHWPMTERISDVRDVGVRRESNHAPRKSKQSEARRSGPDARSEWPRVDLVYGGFPCTDLSLAGKRAGLGGSESGLWFEFERVLRLVRPRWTVIENVVGLLSSNQGRDFGLILHGLADIGFHVGWAVLDSQHFGVPQRRRRVFLVGCTRDRRSAEQVLAICEGGAGHPAPSGQTGESVAALTRDGVGASGPDDITGTIGPTFGAKNYSNLQEVTSGSLVSMMPSLDTKLGTKQWLDDQSVPNYGLMSSAGAGVRRLTPLECERLQGMPDDHTRWTADGTQIADTHRYRMIGNAVAVPVVEWIGHRLMWVDIHGGTK